MNQLGRHGRIKNSLSRPNSMPSLFTDAISRGISGSLRRLRSALPLPGRFDDTCSGVGQEFKLEQESPTSLTTLSLPPLPDPVVLPPPGPGPPTPADRPLLLSPPNKLMSPKGSRVVS